MKNRNGMVEIVRRRGRNLTCKCDCGKTFNTTQERFYKAKSCGCLKKETLKKRAKIKPEDRFGFLSVQNSAGKDDSGNYRWNCLCFCGNLIAVRSSSLLSGKSKSCGCVATALRNDSFYANHPVLAQRLLKKVK